MPSAEHDAILTELNPPYTLIQPVRQLAPVVLCSPHSGRVYPRHFLEQSKLDSQSLRKSEDCFVDELFAGTAASGIPFIAARFPRAFLDVNREPYELDPELFEEPLPDFANTQSVRVAGGLGTVARIVSDGEEIYETPLKLDAVLERIDRLYVPFHAALAGLLEETRRAFGCAVLVDCHSMPSLQTTQNAGPRPDIVLGDRFGMSCDHRITRFLREALAGFGYDVQLNRPYAGGYITEHYGRPQRGLHAIQIEINRGLYLDEVKLEPLPGYDQLKQQLTKLGDRIVSELPILLERRSAAE